MTPFTSLTLSQLAEQLRLAALDGASMDADVPRSRRRALRRAQTLFRAVYRRRARSFREVDGIAGRVIDWLESRYSLTPLQTDSEQDSRDGTRKFLFRLDDGGRVESVLLSASPEEARAKNWTACISSQVGCALACRFCSTGFQGLTRDLKPHEIVGQVLALRGIERVDNLVFMGMGEPLHNFDAVVHACRILLEQTGLNFANRRITISTSGIVPRIDDLRRTLSISLAVSLNATTDEQRDHLMPINRRWNIATLLQACDRYARDSKQPIVFEYVLLSGVNDSLDDAHRLMELTRDIPCKINLIPFNGHPDAEFTQPSYAQVKAFQHELVSRGVTATRRITRGPDIFAACGQLRSREQALT